VVPDAARFATVMRPDLLGGVTVLTSTVRDTQGRKRPLMAIPYYAWSHRGAGEMAVWLRLDRTAVVHDAAADEREHAGRSR
jgi:hypothetical protein